MIVIIIIFDQIAYACGSPSLSNKNIYKRFFRAVVPDTSIVPLHMEMMRLFDWTKIATIHQSYDVFSSVSETAEILLLFCSRCIFKMVRATLSDYLFGMSILFNNVKLFELKSNALPIYEIETNQ